MNEFDLKIKALITTLQVFGLIFALFGFVAIIVYIMTTNLLIGVFLLFAILFGLVFKAVYDDLVWRNHK